MIKRFFFSLNSRKISYLLISGQATVLYGASTFSEDIDIWVSPDAGNWSRFLKLLRTLGARIYKLTPPVSMELINRGHGYHFQLPSSDKEMPFWFLDVMGVVPRSGDFPAAFRNAVYQKTEWGRIPVAGIRDLVEIKKTKRLEDYPVISNLVRIEYEGLSSRQLRPDHWKWILTNSFNSDDMLYYLKKHVTAGSIGAALSRKCIPFFLKAIENKTKVDKYIRLGSKEIALEIEDLRQKDRLYWQPILDELKSMKQKKRLLPVNSLPPEKVE